VSDQWEGCEEVHWDCRIAQLETELARRDDIIARLKKDSDRLFVFAQHIPSCSGTCASGGFCACGLDKVIALHRALMKELE